MRGALPRREVRESALTILAALTVLLFICLFPQGLLPAWGPWHIVAAACLLLAQGALVAALSLHLRRRRAAEAALRENEEWLRLATQAANVAVWSWDVSRNRIRLNPRGDELAGAAGCVERTYEEFLAAVHPEDRERVDRSAQTCLARGGDIDCDFRIFLPNGTIRWIGARGEAVRGGGGVRHILGVSIDITERKQTELALQQGEARYRSIVEDQTDLICRYLPDGTLTFVNEAYCRYFGRRPAELLGQTFWPLIPPEEHDAARRHLASFTSARPLATMEHQVTLPDGRVRWQQWTDRAIFDGEGGLCEFQSVGRDITERRLAEERQALLAAMVASSDDAIITLDLRGRITSWNPAAERFFGCAAREVHGHEAWHLLAPEGTEELIGVFRRVKAGEPMSHGETRRVRRDGSVMSFSLTAWPIRSGSDQVTGVSMAFRDVSERKRADLELELLRRELAHVSRVTMMGELTASLAHELNQPLTAILSNAQAAQAYLGASHTGDVREILQDIAADANRAGEVIRRMRGLLKKGGEVSCAAVDVNEIVREVFLLVRSDGIIRNVAINLDLATGLSLVRGDRVQLQQVLLNLILNALESMARGSEKDRRLILRTERGERGGVRVAVRDAGVGFPTDMLDRAFEPFFSTKPDGMGMGLAITRSIVVAHGGQIWASNNPDRGATVWFELPALDE